MTERMVRNTVTPFRYKYTDVIRNKRKQIKRKEKKPSEIIKAEHLIFIQKGLL